MRTLDYAKMKQEGRKISFTTAYDYWTAQLLNSTPIDGILVGDSAAMIMHGYPDTTAATVETMEIHVQAVSRGAPDKFIVGDLPFMSYRKGIPAAVEASERLIRAGANAVKMEGARGNEAIITHLVESGIPVMGHVGLQPQSVNGVGGYRVQGRDNADEILADAVTLEACGCFSIVIELVTSDVAATITERLRLPTIGIGAGPATDGQILVLQDLAGFNPGFSAKFVRAFGDGAGMLQDAMAAFDNAVKSGDYPSDDESYLP